MKVRSRLLVAIALVALTGCEAKRAREGAPPPPAPAPALAETASAPPPMLDAPLACGTLRDVAVSDVVRLEGKTLYFVDETSGFGVVDVRNADRPQTLARAPFVGTPIVLFVREGVAWIVFVDWDSTRSPGGATVVRALDVREPSKPRALGEIVRAGVARDAKLVDGVLYLMRDAREPGTTSVESFGIHGGALAALDAVTLDGMPAQLVASPAGTAALTTLGDRTRVAWIDLPVTAPGMLHVRDGITLEGGFASWERGDARLASADEDEEVRVVTCATRACAASEGATLHVVGFGKDEGRVGASLELTKRGGLPVTRFADGLLYVVEPSPSEDTSVLHVVKLGEGAPRKLGHVTLRGVISTIVPREGSLVALGTTGKAATRVELVVHDVDLAKLDAPRVRGSVVFGSDWTSSIADSTERALAFDPGSSLVAVPFTAWRRADRTYAAGTELVDLARPGSSTVLPSDGWVERAIFLDGRLVTVGGGEVRSRDYGAVRRVAGPERGLGAD